MRIPKSIKYHISWGKRVQGILYCKKQQTTIFRDRAPSIDVAKCFMKLLKGILSSGINPVLIYSPSSAKNNCIDFPPVKRFWIRLLTLNISQNRHPTYSLSRKIQDQFILNGSVQLLCSSVYFSFIRLHKNFTLSPVIRKTTVLT